MDVELGLKRLDLPGNGVESGGLLISRVRQAWRVVAPIRVLALVEERIKLVVLLLRDRVVLVGVAFRTAHRQSHPNLHRRVHPVTNRLSAKFLVVGAALGVRLGIAMKRRCEQLVTCRLRQQVTGQLLDGELVVRHVLIERLYHPVAIFPDHSQRIRAVAGRVRVTGEIKPDPRPAFAVGRPGHQIVHQQLVGVGALVVHKRLHLPGRGWQPGQVKRQPANDRVAIRQFVGLVPRRLEPGQNKVIDRVPHPFTIVHPRHARPHRRHKRPVSGVGCAAVDPFADGLDFLRSQLVSAVRRWHDVVLISRHQSGEQFTLTTFSGHNRRHALSLGQRPLADIQPQVCLAGFLVRPVAGKTVARQNRANVTVVIHRLGIHRLAKRKKRQTKAPAKNLLLQKKTHVLRKKLTSNHPTGQSIFSAET